MALVPWPAAAFVMAVAAVNCLHLSNFVPEGYAYTGHSSQPEALASVVRKQESRLPASLPVRSTGYTAFLDEHVVKQGAGQRQRSADKQHNTLMFTREGHLYTKPLVLPSSPKHTGEVSAPVSPSTMPQGVKRSLLQTRSGSELNPTLACEGCPTTDTRMLVTDSTQNPWNAVGMVTRNQQGSITSEVVQCSGTLIGESHVLTAGHCVVNIDSGEVISGMQFWPAFNLPDEPFQPISVSRTRVLGRFADQTSVSTTSLNYDFALLTLQDPAPSGTTELAIVETGSEHQNLTTAGYPGDKEQGTMWTVNCNSVDATPLEGCDDCDNMVQHDCLTYQGQSGSGMWSNTNHSIRAIVTGAITISDSTTVNVGIKLNAFVYNTISAWYREDASETLPGHTALAQAPAPAPGPATAPMAAIMAAPMAAPAAAPTPAMAPSGCVY